ncbi:putative cytochrome c oxidase assembly protein [Trichophaea hybrida]|nr:putative cytochrome c oxidase assembly protein [Trichophaea hybrida]
MSRAAKTTLISTIALCGLTVVGVHYLQQSERVTMHAGVLRDEERTRIKRERQEDFEMQAALREELLKGQKVRETSSEGDHRLVGEGGK